MKSYTISEEILQIDFSYRAGCTVLIKTKLSPIPIHTALAIEISPWVTKCIDKIRPSFLWNGADLLSYYLANKKSLHIRSQDLEISMLIGEKKLLTTDITIKFAQNTLMPN